MKGVYKMIDVKKIDQMYYYEGKDLGAVYSKESTSFRVWAPTAEVVKLCLYEKGDGDCLIETIPMMLDVKGTWYTKVDRDLNGIYYTYKVKFQNVENEVVDVYAKTAGVNGQRAMVLDFTSMNPDGWNEDRPIALKKNTDAIIYELHVRDLSSDASAGIKNKYTFKGLTETGTKSPDGLATGLDHIKELGVTHVHLLPLHEFGSVDETCLEENQFNWGYDPVSYSVLEGSYSSDPYHGEVRVKEFKEVVQAFHNNGIGVVMDVVYNHTFKTEDSYFEMTVPGYYYRMKGDEFADASKCGNETASDHLMMRKFMIDSLCHWAKEYHIDGFRFDLMAIHDVDTMNEIAKALRAINPNMLIYGEGWAADVVQLPEDKTAKKANAGLMPQIAMFNDNIRDGVKGHVFYEEKQGFVNGMQGIEEEIKFSVVAATKHPQAMKGKEPAWALHAGQSVNYISAHDDLTLWDKLAISNPDATIEERKAMNRLGAAIVYTAQGIPFMQAGEEMLRTKPAITPGRKYNNDSYNSPDSVNSLKWGQKKEYKDILEYYKGLIAFRKEHGALRMLQSEDIQKNLIFMETSDNVVAYTITKPDNSEALEVICIIYNANPTETQVTIPEGNWSVYVNKELAGTKEIEVITGGTITVPGISALVLGKK